jgi:hypothetical protein
MDWAKLKQLLRSAKARSKDALDRAITEALKLISPDDAKAWSGCPSIRYIYRDNALVCERSGGLIALLVSGLRGENGVK